MNCTDKKYCASIVAIIESAINFLDQRMNIEEDINISNMKAILNAKLPVELITASRCLFSQIFGADVCESWAK